jgi:hypothetical protein
MQEPEKLNLADDELTVALRKLRPAATKQSAREVWYQAGYQSGRRSVNLWRATAAVLLMGMTTVVAWERHSGSPMAVPFSGWALEHVPSQSEREKESAMTKHAQTDPAVTTAGSEYVRLRDSLIRDGLSGLKGRELPSGNPSEPPGERGGPDGLDLLNFYRTNIRG